MTKHPWDCLPTETPKAYAAFLAYVALGARRSVREAAGQHHVKNGLTSRTKTTINTWLDWSTKYQWVSRSLARDAWIANVSDEQIAANVKANLLALTTRAHDFLASKDSTDFLRAARALALHFPPVQRVADVSERIEDLPEMSDEALDRMRAIRDEEREKAKDDA